MNKNIALLAIFVEGALLGGVAAGFVNFMQEQKEFDRDCKRLDDILKRNPFRKEPDTKIDNTSKTVIDTTVVDE